MQIAKIETRVFEDRFFPQLLVQMTTVEGLTGIGECWWGVSPAAPEIRDLNLAPAAMVDPIVSVVENLLRPLLVGRSTERIEDLWQQMIRFTYRYGDEGLVRSAVSGVDLALWDLLGKQLGVPVIQLFGGPVKDGLRAYASLPPLKDPGRLRQEARRARQAGFAGIKLHETNPEAAEIVREEVGSDVALMFDVNGRFSPVEALRIAARLQTCNVCWFEEPVWPMRDHHAMLRIKKEAGIGIAAGENEYNLDSFYRLISSGAADFIMPEITKVGGLTCAKRISALAELFNRILSPHGFRIGPALYANIHWALNCQVSDWIEVPFLPEGYEFPTGIPMPPIEDGMIRLPRGTGLGLPERIG